MEGSFNWVAFAALLLTGVTTLGGVGFGLIKYITTVKDDILKQLETVRLQAERRSEKGRSDAFSHTERLEADLRKAIEYNKSEVQREHSETRDQIGQTRKELEAKLNRLDDRLHEHITEAHICASSKPHKYERSDDG